MENHIDKLNNKGSSQKEKVEDLEGQGPNVKNISLKFVFLIILASLIVGVWLGLSYAVNLSTKVVENYDNNPIENSQNIEWMGVSTIQEDGSEIISIQDTKFKEFTLDMGNAQVKLSDKKIENSNQIDFFFSQSTNNNQEAENNPETFSKGVLTNSRSADSTLYKSQDLIKEIDGFKFNVYEATVESSLKFSIEIEKNGERQDAITDISAYAFSSDSLKLFFKTVEPLNNELADRVWIKDIRSNYFASLPDSECLNQRPTWFGDKLVTSTVTEAKKADKTSYYNSDICIFDENGNLLSRIDANLSTNVGIIDLFGLLPNDSEIFYTYTGRILKNDDSSKTLICSLFLLDTAKKTEALKYVDLVTIRNFTHPHQCSETLGNIDLKLLNFESGKLAFRIKDVDEFKRSGLEKFTPWVVVENK